MSALFAAPQFYLQLNRSELEFCTGFGHLPSIKTDYCHQSPEFWVRGVYEVCADACDKQICLVMKRFAHPHP